jgi:ABC-type uncharacterized transport system substrate-binding protein
MRSTALRKKWKNHMDTNMSTDKKIVYVVFQRDINDVINETYFDSVYASKQDAENQVKVLFFRAAQLGDNSLVSYIVETELK